jgi:MFS family permease
VVAEEQKRSLHQEPLDPNEILVAEFNYIASTAFQANEDRARVSNYYLMTAGAAVAAILGAKIEGLMPTAIHWGFAAVFGALAIIGLLTVLQLARLRSAWMASARAMNEIKGYYVERCPDAQLEQAFTWTNESLPSPSKRGSVAFLLALSVMLVDGGAVMASVAFLGLGVNQARPVLWLLLGLLVSLVFIGIQLKLYLDWVSK